MLSFKIVNNIKEIVANDKWIDSPKFKSKDRLVDAKGKTVGASDTGIRYRIVSKQEREFSGLERTGRGLLGVIALVCTLGVAYFSKRVMKLITKQKETMRYAILDPTDKSVADKGKHAAASVTATKVVEMLSAHYKIVYKNMMTALDPSAEIKLKGQEIIELLPQLEDAELPIDKENRASLLRAIINTEPDCFKKLVPTLKPAILKQIVDICLNWEVSLYGDYKSESDVVLALICGGLEPLPASHPSREAFVQAFPSSKQLPTIPEGLNYKERQKAVEPYLYHDQPHKPARNRAQQCLRFVQSPAFVKALSGFSEDQKTTLIQNLCEHGIFYFDITRHEGKETSDKLLAFAQRLAPHSRIVLESFSNNIQAEFLGQICSQPQADKALVESILVRNPVDKGIKNEGFGYVHDRDPFFSKFLGAINAGNDKEKILQWLMEIVFAGTDEVRKDVLIDHFRYGQRAFLAKHFAQLPQPIVKKIPSQQLIELADFAFQTSGLSADNKKAIAQALSRSSLQNYEILKNEGTFHALFDDGEVDLQALILASVLQNSLVSYEYKQSPMLNTLMSKASAAVWQAVGEKLSRNQDQRVREKLNAEFLKTMQTDCTSAQLIAFANGLASPSQPTAQNEKSVASPHTTTILSLLFNVDGTPRVAIPFADMSEPLLACINRYGKMYFAKEWSILTTESTPTDYLWYNLLRAIKQPEQEGEKRIVASLSRQMLRSDHYSSDESVHLFLKTLTAAQIKQLPLSDYPKPLQIMLILLSDSPSNHADQLRELTSSLSDDDAKWKTSSLYEKIGKPKTAEFVRILAEKEPSVSSLFGQTLVRGFCSSADEAGLLTLPRPLLMANLKAINKQETRIQLLQSLPPLEAREALNILWEYFFYHGSSDYRSLLHAWFPFGSLIRILEEPAKISQIASAPAGSMGNQLVSSHQWGHVLRDVLAALEQTPWKIWVSIDAMDVGSLCQWNGGYDNVDPRQRFPKCFEIFD